MAIWTPETFTTKPYPFTGAALMKLGSVPVGVDGVPSGRYAVYAYRDEDGGGCLQLGLFGVPAEAIGFSRDALVRLSAPSFENATIDIEEPATATRLRLHNLGH